MMDNNTSFGAYLNSAGTSSINCNDEQGGLSYSAGPHRNRCQLQPTQEEKGEVLGKNAGGWTGRTEVSSRKKSPAVGEACTAIFRPTPGIKGRTFKLWVLNIWVFHFCVHSAPCGGIRQTPL